MDPLTFLDHAKQVLTILLGMQESDDTITYGELARQAGMGTGVRAYKRDLPEMLKWLALKWPDLPYRRVVRKIDGQPGKGAYRDLTLHQVLQQERSNP